ncbi:MAG: hypothetical protein LC750_00645, partial [Actinobacteria bacterium]|nr:hypothetical protein [Actinomycetota bacterium]
KAGTWNGGHHTDFKGETMTSPVGPLNSDSVDLGSNPGSPATTNADVSGVSRNLSEPEKSEIPEQTAHAGRTLPGTATDCPSCGGRGVVRGLGEMRDQVFECSRCEGWGWASVPAGAAR